MSLAAIVDRVAEREPTNIAISGTRSVTYDELKNLSLQISTVLRAENFRRIGIFLPSSIDFFVSLVGINRIGSAFVPLDPALPTERLRQMAERSEIDAIISSKDLMDSLSFFGKRVFFTESIYAKQKVTADQDYSHAPENLCYVIFTSGSTGHPKGCILTYQNLENYIQNADGIYSLNEDDRVLQFASISFDTFLEETCCAWNVGATLVLKKKNKFSSHHELLQFVREERISVLDLPSSLWHSLVDELEANASLSLPPCVGTIIVGGESVSLKHVRIWLSKYNKVRLINTYGISECAIVSSSWQPASLSDLDNHDHTPIGKPLDNVSFTVLDEQRRPVAAGKTGELYISGVSVGDGYINDDELTRASFVADILDTGSGTVFYRTGDVVKLCSDGLFEYVGRTGSFINVNGIRVDLCEIENVIKRFPEVQDCKVIYSSKDNAGIHAFIKSQAGLGYPSVVLFAQQYLPQYMIPKNIFSLAEFPLNRHGKISESELLKIVEEKRPHATAIAEVVLTEVQAKLKGIFQNILQRAEVSLDETFFSLGGDSISSMNLLSQIEMTFEVDIPSDYLFRNGTILGLAEYIEDSGTTSTDAFFLLNRIPFKDKTILLIPGSLGDVLCYSDLVKDLEVDNPLYGASYPGRYDDKKPLQSLTEYAQYYADSIERQKLQEPFVIAGYSSGGWIAYTLANELLNRNVKVAKVFLIDSAQPNFVDTTSRRSTMLPPVPPLGLNLLWFIWGLTRFFGNELVQNPGVMPMLLRDFSSRLRSGKLWKGLTVDEFRVDPINLYVCARIGFFGREIPIPAGRYARSGERERFAIVLQEGKKISLFPDAYTLEDIEKSWQMILSIIGLENIDSLPPSKNRLVLIRTKPHYGLRMFFPAGKKHDFGWGKLVGNQIKVFEVEGTHLQILRRPYIRKVAEIMRANLNSA